VHPCESGVNIGEPQLLALTNPVLLGNPACFLPALDVQTTRTLLLAMFALPADELGLAVAFCPQTAGGFPRSVAVNNLMEKTL
jgi:hypothetical protein